MELLIKLDDEVAGERKVPRTRAKQRLRLEAAELAVDSEEFATRVAGFRAGLKLGYCVRRGETSRIRVWAPCPPSNKKLLAWRNARAIAADKPRTYFRLEAVFSALQVEPLPPPAEPEPLDPPIAAVQGDTLAWAVEPLAQLADELGYAVVYTPLAEGYGGSCNPRAKVLTISSDQAVNAQVDVACHELAHALVRQDRHDASSTHSEPRKHPTPGQP